MPTVERIRQWLTTDQLGGGRGWHRSRTWFDLWDDVPTRQYRDTLALKFNRVILLNRDADDVEKEKNLRAAAQAEGFEIEEIDGEQMGKLRPLVDDGGLKLPKMAAFIDALGPLLADKFVTPHPTDVGITLARLQNAFAHQGKKKYALVSPEGIPFNFWDNVEDAMLGYLKIKNLKGKRLVEL